MSLLTLTTGFLAIKPDVRVDGDRLIARASAVWRCGSFGGYDRTVVADRHERTVAIDTTTWWKRQPTAIIPFDRIVEIDRQFNRWTTERSPGPRYRYTSWRNDQLEFYTISLFLQNPQETIDLFCFSGEGSVETGLTGVLLGNDDVVDVAGDERAASEQYARLLAQFTRTRVHQFAPDRRWEAADNFLH